jgi:hypothetical protein
VARIPDVLPCGYRAVVSLAATLVRIRSDVVNTA